MLNAEILAGSLVSMCGRRVSQGLSLTGSNLTHALMSSPRGVKEACKIGRSSACACGSSGHILTYHRRPLCKF